jgi:excisionase family DNA binding protein
MSTCETTNHLLTVAEAASLLRVSRATAYRLVAAKELPAHRVGGSIRIDHGEMLDALSLPRAEDDTNG